MSVLRRKVIYDQDTLGPATSNLQGLLMLLQSPEIELLGITVPSGDHWRDQQVRHALRLLEIVGRPDIPVVPGAVQPLVNTVESLARWEQQYGRLVFKGCWDFERPGKYKDPAHTPDLPEGNPSLTPLNEHAANFLIRMTRQFPDEISIIAAAPHTNLALACRLDPDFPRRARELAFMGGSFNPQTDAREFKNSPRREFNLRHDPEAASIVLRSPWRQITCTPIDATQEIKSSATLFAGIAKADTPVARYLAQWATPDRPMWDEVAAAAFVDPGLVAQSDEVYMDVDLSRDAGYGNVLSWSPGFQPGLGESLVRVHRKIDEIAFKELFRLRMSSPTPKALADGK